MDRIAILSKDCSFFASPYLAEAIGVDLYVIDMQHNNFFTGGRKAKYWNNGDAIDCEHLIVVSCEALIVAAPLIGRSKFKTVAVVLCDTYACRERKWCDAFIKNNNLFVYAMPDIFPFHEMKMIPVYQTIQLNQLKDKPKEKLIISHSPSCDGKAALKGTTFVLETIDRLRVNHSFQFDLIKNLGMAECLSIKGQSHIFIDQMVYGNPDIWQGKWGGEIPYKGGLGKSGIEAMLLGSCVITGGVDPDTGEYFSPPPVVWTSYDNFYIDLERLIEDIDYRQKKTIEQGEWAAKYLSAGFVAKHITQHIKWK